MREEKRPKLRGGVFTLSVPALTLMIVSSAWAQSTTTPGQALDFGWKDGITLAIAILGAGLGIYNAFVAREARKVKLKVVPGWSFAPGYTAFSIEVINLSNFDVTLEQIGFLERWSKRTLPLVHPGVTDGGPWPRKLGAREAVNVHLDPNDLPTGIRLGRAFVQTVSDERGTGTNGAHKQLARLVRTGTLAVQPHFGGRPSRTIRSIHARPKEQVGG